MLVVSEKLEGCSLGLTSLCPVSVGSVNINSNVEVPASVAAKIPSIAYEIPDIDGIARIWINDTSGTPLGCVEAFLENGKTVDQKVVSWITAIIAGGALLSSAIASGLGHSNTAAHVASAAVLLFGYFQAVAIAGMVSVQLPPIVASWTQDFQWSMGIIKLSFMQSIFTWYIKSTGGTPSTLLLQPVGTNVVVEKRDLLPNLAVRSMEHLRRLQPTALVNLFKRQSVVTPGSALTLKGIQRVAYRAGIEQTNLFMTGYAFFIVLVFGSALGVYPSFPKSYTNCRSWHSKVLLNSHKK
jgi:Transient receptor potential (TRP) ion channel/ML-like domain